MALFAAMTLPATTITLDLEQPERCPACHAAMLAVELHLGAVGRPGTVREGALEMTMHTSGALVRALPCGCTIHEREGETGDA